MVPEPKAKNQLLGGFVAVATSDLSNLWMQIHHKHTLQKHLNFAFAVLKLGAAILWAHVILYG